jgi:hypothetical protein
MTCEFRVRRRHCPVALPSQLPCIHAVNSAVRAEQIEHCAFLTRGAPYCKFEHATVCGIPLI